MISTLAVTLFANSLYVFELNTRIIFQDAHCQNDKKKNCPAVELKDSWIEQAVKAAKNF
jgi:hypothetical protein